MKAIRQEDNENHESWPLMLRQTDRRTLRVKMLCAWWPSQGKAPGFHKEHLANLSQDMSNQTSMPGIGYPSSYDFTKKPEAQQQKHAFCGDSAPKPYKSSRLDPQSAQSPQSPPPAPAAHTRKPHPWIRLIRAFPVPQHCQSQGACRGGRLLFCRGGGMLGTPKASLASKMGFPIVSPSNPPIHGKLTESCES